MKWRHFDFSSKQDAVTRQQTKTAKPLQIEVFLPKPLPAGTASACPGNNKQTAKASAPQSVLPALSARVYVTTIL